MSLIPALLMYLATGAAAGVLAGLFGVGGGLIMVPALVLLLPRQDVTPELVMHVAIGTSLAVIAATSISSTLAHHRRGGVLWPAFWRFAAGLALGALLGAFVADRLSGMALTRIVGFGALLVALQMLLVRPGPAQGEERLRAGNAELAAAGGLIGLLSSLIGIGGGSLSVPYLSLRGASMRQAVGTAAAGGLPIAWAGALGYVIAGWKAPGLPPASLGYVNLLGLVGLGGVSVLTAPLGARLAHRLPPAQLRRAFALLLVGIGSWMLLK